MPELAFYRKLDNLSTMQVVSGIEAITDAGFEVKDEKVFDSIGTYKICKKTVKMGPESFLIIK